MVGQAIQFNPPPLLFLAVNVLVLEDRVCTIIYVFSLQICVSKLVVILDYSPVSVLGTECWLFEIESGYGVIKTVGLLTGSLGSLGRMLTVLLQ